MWSATPPSTRAKLCSTPRPSSRSLWTLLEVTPIPLKYPWTKAAIWDTRPPFFFLQILALLHPPVVLSALQSQPQSPLLSPAQKSTTPWIKLDGASRKTMELCPQTTDPEVSSCPTVCQSPLGQEKFQLGLFVEIWTWKVKNWLSCRPYKWKMTEVTYDLCISDEKLVLDWFCHIAVCRNNKDPASKNHSQSFKAWWWILVVKQCEQCLFVLSCTKRAANIPGNALTFWRLFSCTVFMLTS